MIFMCFMCFMFRFSVFPYAVFQRETGEDHEEMKKTRF